MNIKKLCLTLIFTLVLSSVTIYAQNLDSRAGDEQALLDLYNSTNGQNWHDKTGWNGESVSLDNKMAGVTVALRDGELRVTAIDMQKVTTNANNETLGNNLTGTLPSSLGNLKYVEKLNVKQNNLSGEMPPEIGYMTSLRRLSLGGQQCEIDLDNITEWYEGEHTGRCNSVGGGKRFEETNEFSGPLPGEWGNLENIELIEVRRQYLTGTLPDSWGGLSTLRALFINDSKGSGPDLIGGEIPESWGGMVSMQWFQLSNYAGNARFKGIFPQSAQDNWSNLNHIKIDDNNFEGPVPEFPESKNLKYVRFSNNNFTGEFPVSYFNGNNSNISLFSISNNDLTGVIPDVPSPTYPTSKKYYAPGAFHITGNSFDGPLPDWIQRNHRNIQFQIRGNNFTGQFPKTVAEQPRLRLFWIDWNNFSGELPDVSWNSNELTNITINGNNFKGPIPESWGSIIYNHLDENGDFTGRFYRFEARNMDLSGPIPDWVYDVPEWGPDGTASARRFRIQNNRFTFRDLLPTHEYLKSNLGDGYIVTPQKPFGTRTERTMPAGESLIIDLSEYDYQGNQYQWYKDGEALSGANSSVLTIDNITDSDEGEYILKVNNPALPELGEHSSEPIVFTIGENDGLNGDGSNGDSDSENSGSSSDGNGFPASPNLHSPSHLQQNVSLQPSLKWSSVEGADYYILNMSRNSPNGMVLDVIVEDTTYTPKEILGQESRHQWRVRAVRNGEMGEWSDVYWFDTEVSDIPAMADLVGPDHYSENVDVLPNLKWENVDADKFLLRIFEKGGLGAVTQDESLTSNYTPVNPLTAETNYIWQVKSVKNGVEGAWGPRWEFSTGDYIYPVEQPELISPNNGSESEILSPTFKWQAVDADHYVITISEEPPTNAKTLESSGTENESQVLYDETPETLYSVNQPLEPEKQYYWRVKAVKEGDEGEWSDTWEFWTPAATTGIDSGDGESPVHTELKQNYPNPFNPSTQIEFTLAEAQRVSLTVYNTAGQLVATLVDDVTMRAGRHSATFNAVNLASGVYIYRLIYGNKALKPQKMTLLK